MSEMLDRLKIDKGKSPSVTAGNGKLWLFLVSAIIIILILLALILFKNRTVTVETTNVSQVYPAQGFTLLNASGYVVAQRKAAVAAKTTGRLEWLGVEEGSRVKAGEVVARLENRDLAASLEQAVASVHSSESLIVQLKAERSDAAQSFNRIKELLKHGIVARSEYDTAEARYHRALAAVSGAEASLRVAQASRKGAEIALDYSLIRAPFDAVVLTKNADIGDIITPLGAAANAKAAVVTIADLSSLEVEADVSETSLSLVRQNQPCEVSLDALQGERFRAIVHTIVPTADRSKASVMVKVRFLEYDPRILPEMSAKVAFLSRAPAKDEEKSRIAISPAAVVKRGNDYGVFRIVDGKARFTPINPGQKLGELVEVNGLKGSDKLILKPSESIRDGSPVRVPEK